MSLNRPFISGDHKTQLLSDTIHASVVVIVVACVTLLAVIVPDVVPRNVIGTVYGGAIGYAAGRAGNVIRSTSSGPQSTDAPRSYGNNGK